MMKILKQALVSLLLFATVLYGFSRVNWLSVFHLEEDVIEEKLGKIYWDFFSDTEELVEDEEVLQPVDSLLAYLCRANGIERPVKLHIAKSSEVNAFALPDRHLVVYSSLIADCRNEMELCGVMAHELAHMEKGHVMKKLIKEVGLSVLAGMVAGNDGGVLKETARLLSSTAYDRTLESEADECAVAYLVEADINPEPLGDFLYRLSEEEDVSSLAEWVSTHPDSKKRSSMIWEEAKRLKRTSAFREVLGVESFDRLKEKARLLTQKKR